MNVALTPTVVASSGSKLLMRSSLKNRTTTSRSIANTAASFHTAPGTRPPSASAAIVSVAPYNTQPGSRSTLSAARTIMINPIANSAVNTTPIDADSSTLPNLETHCVSTAVSTPTTAAPMNIGTLSRLPVMRNAAASPGSTAWEMASPIMLILRSTRKLPSSAQAMAQRTPAAMIQPSICQDQMMEATVNIVTYVRPRSSAAPYLESHVDLVAPFFLMIRRPP